MSENIPPTIKDFEVAKANANRIWWAYGEACIIAAGRTEYDWEEADKLQGDYAAALEVLRALRLALDAQEAQDAAAFLEALDALPEH